MTFATLLTQEEVERVHEASLEILENVGLLVRHPKARAVFQKNGCKVDSQTQIVKFPRPVVENFRSMLPPTFTFRGRETKYDRTIPQRRSTDRHRQLCSRYHRSSDGPRAPFPF